MNRRVKLGIMLLVLLALVVVLPLAQAAGELHLPFWTIDSGGGASQGGSFSLSGTLGQTDAGEMQGGSYVLEGGFWSGQVISTPATSRNIYLPWIIH